MKKFLCLCFVTLLALVTFCPAAGPEILPTHIVSHIDILQSGTLLRHYSREDKLQGVLLHLRLLKPEGPPLIAPSASPHQSFEIRITLLNRQQHIYRQKAHRYLQWENGPWCQIDPEQAANLYHVLLAYPSDDVLPS